MSMHDREGWSSKDYLDHCNSHNYSPGEHPEHSFPRESSVKLEEQKPEKVQDPIQRRNTSWFYLEDLLGGIGELAKVASIASFAYLCYNGYNVYEEYQKLSMPWLNFSQVNLEYYCRQAAFGFGGTMFLGMLSAFLSEDSVGVRINK